MIEIISDSDLLINYGYSDYVSQYVSRDVAILLIEINHQIGGRQHQIFHDSRSLVFFNGYMTGQFFPQLSVMKVGSKLRVRYYSSYFKREFAEVTDITKIIRCISEYDVSSESEDDMIKFYDHFAEFQ